jgi:pimeloyl-ACP methyl ester carboxylesterase
MLVLWLLVGIAAGWLAGAGAIQFLGFPTALAILFGGVVGLGAFALLRPLANRWFVIQINSHWPHLREFARGEPNCFDGPIEAGAQRLVTIAREGAVDEIVVVGHSGGAAIAPAVIARALELDPDIGRHGPRLVMITIGSVMPASGLHPSAERQRAVIRRCAIEPGLFWADVQARQDLLNFWNFDPVGGIGISLGAERCNPHVWQVNMRDMMVPAFFRRMRFHFFRIHYQFIMANDKRAPYDYFMLVCGPVPIEEWAKNGRAVVARFAADGSYGEPNASISRSSEVDALATGAAAAR